MSTYFATKSEICEKTVRVDVNGAIRLLNAAKEGSDEELAQAREEVGRLCPAGGPLVYCNPDGSSQVIDADSHSVIFASTGKGKTRRFIYPTVYSDILSGTNFVVNDMKGEIYEMTKGLLDEMGYHTYVLDLRDPKNSPARYNPLGMAWDAWQEGRGDDAFMVIRSFALCVFTSVESGRDPYWHNAATDYFTGLALSMLEKGAKRDEFTLESIAALDGRGSEEAFPRFFSPEGKSAWGIRRSPSAVSGRIGTACQRAASRISTFRARSTHLIPPGPPS